MRPHRVLALVLAFAAIALATPGARAQTTTDTSVLDEAASALRSDPVYVHADAERSLASDDAARVRDAIRSSGEPIFVAVLPSAAVDEAGGDPTDVPRVLGQRTALDGTYAVVVGDSFRAASSTLSAGEAGAIATGAFQANSTRGTTAVLLAFVDGVAEAAGGSPGASGGGSSSSEDDGGGSGVAPLLLVGGAGALGVWAWRSSRRRRREAADARAEYDADRQVLQAELSVVASDVLTLEPQVQLHENARADYDAAVTRYRAASAALEYADDEIDLVRVRRVLLEAQYALARTRAAIDGREPPPPPPELQRPGAHDEPPIELDPDRREPVYVGGGPFYGGGWFGGAGSLFGGLLLGSILSPWGWGGGMGGGWGDGGDGGDGGGWGDVGGGDWGGGGDFDVGGGGGDW
jgi:hypothetical protein